MTAENATGHGRAGVVTLPFTYIVGSTQLLARLGEDGAEILRRPRPVRRVVSEAGGRATEPPPPRGRCRERRRDRWHDVVG